MQPSKALVRTSFRVESFVDVWPEIEKLMPLHYQEVSADVGRFGPKLDRQTYTVRQLSGSLLILTARREGELIGYAVWTIAPHLHYQDSGLMAYSDAYFVKKEFRNGATGYKLLLASEVILREKGVKKLFNFHKLHREDLNHSKLFDKLGYQLNEYQYIKYLK